MTTWPDLETTSPNLRALLRRIDHPRTGPHRRRDERPQLWTALQI